MGQHRVFAIVLGALVGVAILPFGLQFIRSLFGSADDEDDHHTDDHDDDLDDNDDDAREVLHGDVLQLPEDGAASEHFFGLWLGASMMLSTARFDDVNNNGVDLNIAQRHMMDEIAARLELRRGMRVLEVESGWGVYALYLAEQYGVRVTGCCRDAFRVASATRRAEEADLGPGAVQFVHGDVSEELGTFHRIIRIALSEIEMRVPQELFFPMLEDDGQALVHETKSPRLQSDLPPAHADAPNPRFDIEREDITTSFGRTLRMWSDNLNARWREGQLELFEERTREWRGRLQHLSTENANNVRGLEQVVYTKRPR